MVLNIICFDIQSQNLNQHKSDKLSDSVKNNQNNDTLKLRYFLEIWIFLITKIWCYSQIILLISFTKLADELALSPKNLNLQEIAIKMPLGGKFIVNSCSEACLE